MIIRVGGYSNRLLTYYYLYGEKRINKINCRASNDLPLHKIPPNIGEEAGFMNKMSIDDRHVKGKRVLVRVDFNVPVDDSGNITDDRGLKPLFLR